MSYWKRNLFLLWFSQLLVMAGFSAMIPFIPLFIECELHVTDLRDLALYVSMFNFFGTMAYAVFCPVWGVLSDRYGIKPMLLRGTFVTAFFFPMMGYVHTPGMLIFLRFLTAACAGTTAASHIMIARTAPDDRQGFAQGVLTTAVWGGAMLGNVIGGMLIHYFSYLCAFWFCGILYFIAGFSVLFTKDNFTPVKKSAKVQTVHHRKKWGPVFTNSVWILLGLFLAMGIVRQFETPFIAMKIKELSTPETAAYWTGIVSAVVCCGAILSGVVTGWLADRLSPGKLMIPVMVVSAISLFVQGAAQSLWIFAAARTVLYIAAGGIQPVLQKFLSSLTPNRKRGSVFGFSTTAGQGGGMLAAVFGGWSVATLGLNGVFYTAGVLFLLTLPLFLKGLQYAMEQPFFQAHCGTLLQKKGGSIKKNGISA